MSIRLAIAAEVELLPAIELAAGEPFRTAGMEEVADDEPPAATELLAYQLDRRCWVAVQTEADTTDEVVIGYLIAEVLDGLGHIEQVSVLPSFRGSGIGRQLIERAEQWAIDQGFEAMTLTTFVEVPWNGPYYQRLGYRYLNPGELSPQLAAVRSEEKAAGLDRWPRAAMQKELDRGPKSKKRATG